MNLKKAVDEFIDNDMHMHCIKTGRAKSLCEGLAVMIRNHPICEGKEPTEYIRQLEDVADLLGEYLQRLDSESLDLEEKLFQIIIKWEANNE